MNMRIFALPIFVLTMMAVLAACTPPYVVPEELPIPTPTPSPGVVMLTSATLSFLAVGATNAQSTVASETNYKGTFSASTTTCAAIATISQSGSSFTVTPVAAGGCAFIVSGAPGQSATLTVNVTTTSVGGN